ncbi:MAG TPA: YkgJ family cysteine cluster protein [Verrucomicrobiota bacterium]|nr:YkgJ family cysteine cluster protein [Verrucomicrobiota bacterium]
MPVFYECQRCTACCRWPGQVRLSDAEITRLATFKGVSEGEFIQCYTRLREDRRGLALQEKPDGACVFLDGDDCSVQPVKPQQCRDFPNLWNFPGFEKTCRAIPRIVGEAEHSRLIAQVKLAGSTSERGERAPITPTG